MAGEEEPPVVVASFEGTIYRQCFANKAEAESAIVEDLVRRSKIFGLVWEGEGENKEIAFLTTHVENFEDRLVRCLQAQDHFTTCLDEFAPELSQLPLQGIGLDQFAEFLDVLAEKNPWDIAEL